MLVAYVYDTYTSYKVDINKNLTKSEDHINKTTKSFNKLQDNVDTDISDIKNKHETLESKYSDNLTTYTSNLNNLVEVRDNKNSNIGSNLFQDNITAYDKNDIELNLLTNLSTNNNILAHTSSNNYVNICDNTTGKDKNNYYCAAMNVDMNHVFNISPTNSKYNTSNISKMQIKGITPSVGIGSTTQATPTLAEFDFTTNSIKFGDTTNPAIQINNNIYTAPLISGSYSITAPATATTPATATLTITFFNNLPIPANAFINFYFQTQPTITTVTSSVTTINTITFTNNILKFKTNALIAATTSTTLSFTLTGTISPVSATTIMGYLTSS
jgi:Txe/YoeB family toxin of Txe-Axe toxin-antitoxin module